MKGTILQLCKYVIFMAFDSNLPYELVIELME